MPWKSPGSTPTPTPTPTPQQPQPQPQLLNIRGDEDSKPLSATGTHQPIMRLIMVVGLCSG